jgi:hypothetical protein
MNTLYECFLVGFICMIIYNYMYIRINKKNKRNRYCSLLCFLFGFLLHYLIKNNNLTDLYCKKVCYNDECFMVCKV